MKKSSTASLAAALLLLTACTHSNQQISTTPPEEQLANSVIAYSMSTDYHSAGGLENNPGGSILFYNPDTKTWTDVATDGMEHSRLTYRDQTLYYTDYQTDYALTPKGLATAEHQDHQAPRIPLMFGIPQDRGGGMIALANQGSEDDGSGYLWDIIVTQGNKRTVHPLEHYIGYAAQCEDGSVWGWSNPYLTSNTSDYGAANAPQQILQLYPDFKPDPVATIEHERRYSTGNSLDCADGVLYYIIDNYKPEVTDPYGGGPDDFDGSSLVSYDTRTGIFDKRDINGDWAIRSTDEMWNSELIYRHIYQGGLYWISGSGDLVRTDLKTAHNTKILTLQGYDIETESPGLIAFEGPYLFQSIPRFGRDTDFYRYNLTTGEMESHAKLPDYKNVDKKYQFPSAMVITNLDKALKL
ncbi:hypothetical protein [Rothia sp. P4278]|uniref:hypothetical protein n=1 Tax=Rothia sp. P4278 TaxID=3402658 RepID=UPI003ADE836A